MACAARNAIERCSDSAHSLSSSLSSGLRYTVIWSLLVGMAERVDDRININPLKLKTGNLL
jgi:hypothetical protein